MSALLAALLLLPSAVRAARSPPPSAAGLSAIKQRADALRAEADAVLAELGDVRRAYETAEDQAGLLERHGNLIQQAERTRIRVVALIEEHKELESRLYGEAVIKRFSAGLTGRREVSQKDVLAVLDVGAVSAELIELRQRLRGQVYESVELHKSWAARARARRRLRAAAAGTIGLAALAGFLLWRRRGRAGDPALSGPA